MLDYRNTILLLKLILREYFLTKIAFHTTIHQPCNYINSLEYNGPAI